LRRFTSAVEAISALLIASAFGCSLLVDASDVDAGCPEGQKVCGGACVDISNPAYGCSLTDCEPCKLLNAIAKCADMTCKVEFCEYGYGCPLDREGCKVEVLSDRSHCGYCGNSCDGDQVCSNGECEPVEAQ
jgi:hypothetical protein